MRALLLALVIILSPPLSIKAGIKFDFFGIEVKLKHTTSNNEVRFVHPDRNPEKFKYLELIIHKDIKPELYVEIKVYEKEFEIEEFALIELLKKLSSFYSDDKNIQAIFLRELILGFGFDAVHYSDGRDLFVYAKYDSFFLSIPYKEIGPQSFYVDVMYKKRSQNLDLRRLNEYKQNSRVIRLSEFHFRNPTGNETISGVFRHNAVDYQISYDLNNSWVEYLSSLPNFQMEVNYTDRRASNAVLIPFQKVLNEAGITDTVGKINFVLSYCQGLKYVDDLKSFKSEKTMFPIESIKNGFGDCDDKSILFNFLVQECLGLKVCYLFYEGKNHVNTGVCLNKKSEGLQSFKSGQIEFVVCDPSMAGSKVGEQSQKYKGVTPRILLVNR